MALFNSPLGINLTDNNPLKVSPFVYAAFAGNSEPPGPPEDITTEGGDPIITEDGVFLTTE